MSRFRTFILLAALLASMTTFAACGSGGSDDPQQVLDEATLEGVESGNLEVWLSTNAEGQTGGDLDVNLSGAFQSTEGEDLPNLSMTASAKGNAQGDPVDFEGGLTLLPGRAFINYEGVDYAVDSTTYSFVKSSFEQAQNQGGEGNPADLTACQEAAEGIAVPDFVENLRSEEGVDVEGTETTKVSGNLDTGSAIDALIKLAEDPACSTQLEAAGPLPIDELEEAKSELTGAVKKAQIEVYVGDDDIIRRVAADVTVEPEGTSGEKLDIDFELTLSGVNEEQEISAPSDPKPLNAFFRKAGINPVELLELANSGEGLGELLEELTGELDLGGSGSGGGGEAGAEGGGRKAYLQCLKDARTSADLQQCAAMIQ